MVRPKTLDCLRHNHSTWMVMPLNFFGITIQHGRQLTVWWLCRRQLTVFGVTIQLGNCSFSRTIHLDWVQLNYLILFFHWDLNWGFRKCQLSSYHKLLPWSLLLPAGLIFLYVTYIIDVTFFSVVSHRCPTKWKNCNNQNRVARESHI
jgi:hypothetical protein